MKIIAKAMWLGILLTTVAAPSANAIPLFFDDFTTGPSASWGNESGNWTALAGVYYAQNPSNFPNARSLVAGLALTDFSVDVDVNSGADGGIWLRAANTSTSVGATGVLLVWAHGNIYWHVVTSGGYGSSLSLASFAAGNFSLHVDVQGNVFSAFVNGSATPITTLTSSTFTSGQAGLYDNNANQTFDNFQISAVPLPAALPLFASGAGLLGFFGWRRKRKMAKAAA